MTVNRSGICKVPNCNKLQVRDGFCKQCGEYYLQKSILKKLTTVSSELANFTQPNTQIVQQNTDNQLLVNILSQQTNLLQGVVTGLHELKKSIDNNSPQISQLQPVESKKINLEDDTDIFIPSSESIDTSGKAKIVDENNEQEDSTRDLSSIADRLKNFDI